MVDYHYEDNLVKHSNRRRWWRVIAGVFGLFVLIVGGIIIYDGLRVNTVVNVQTQPTVQGEAEERAFFDEPEFTLSAPPSWSKIESRESTRFHYQSIEDGNVKRDLRVYVNQVPFEFATPYILPIEKDVKKIIPLTISPQCQELVKDQDDPSDQFTTWAGVRFLCDPDGGQYLAATSHNEDGYATKITDAAGDRTFFFAYRDFTTDPKFEIFSNLLRNFEAK